MCNQEGGEDSESWPFLVVGAEELTEPLGRQIECPHCGKWHPVISTRSEPREGSTGISLETYSCDKTGGSYLAGIDGQKFNK